MAATNRLRYNGVLCGTATPTLGASISSSGTAVTFPAPLKYDGAVAVATIADPDYLPLVVDPDTSSMEIVWLTAYTAGATSGTIVRGKEGTAGVAHSSGAPVVHGPTAADIAVGVPVVRKFPFAYNTSGILTGAALYTPTVGDVLLDAWIEILTVWDGTTPYGDFFAGAYPSGNQGLLQYGGDVNALWNMGAGAGNKSLPFSQVQVLYAAVYGLSVSGAALSPGGPLNHGAYLPRTVADPIKVVVSQDGTKTGADPGSTQGAAVLYLVTATPA